MTEHRCDKMQEWHSVYWSEDNEGWIAMDLFSYWIWVDYCPYCGAKLEGGEDETHMQDM